MSHWSCLLFLAHVRTDGSSTDISVYYDDRVWTEVNVGRTPVGGSHLS
jgi:hypothetical protein